MSASKCIFISLLSFGVFFPHRNQHFISITEAFPPYISLFSYLLNEFSVENQLYIYIFCNSEIVF